MSCERFYPPKDNCYASCGFDLASDWTPLNEFHCNNPWWDFITVHVLIYIKVQILVNSLITIALVQFREFIYKDGFHVLISYFIHKTCTSNYVLIFIGELSSSSPIPTLNSPVYTLPALVLMPLPAFVLRLTLAFSRFTGYASTQEKGKISLS